MMDTEELNKFCDKSNPDLSEPFVIDGEAGASDGHILIIAEGVAGIARKFPYLPRFPLKPDHQGEWVKIPKHPEPEKIKCQSCYGLGKSTICEECEGEGSVEFANADNLYSFECKSCCGVGITNGGCEICEDCDGTGVNYKWPEVVIPGGKVTARLLNKIEDLPNVLIFMPINKSAFLYFSFDGGYGVLMALRD